jgi:hypothetical protein
MIPCPNFDPIYQVILLKNFNEWDLSPAKSWILKKKKKKKQGLKSKWGEPHLKTSMFQKEKRKRGWDLQAVGRDSIEIKQERISHFPIVQNPICGIIRTHISFAFALSLIPWLFPFLAPPTTTPFSINHDYLPHKLFKIFRCFYNIQGVA